MKVLILAYDFPPYQSIASQRPYSWLNYFGKSTELTTVVTLHWDNKIENDKDYIIPSFQKEEKVEKTKHGQIIRAPFYPNHRDKFLFKYGFNKHSFFRKILTFFYLLGKNGFFALDNTRGIFFSALGELQKTDYDVIVATGEPFILFKYASILSKRFDIPWVGDYRDPWTTSLSLNNADLLTRLTNKYYFRRLELKYLKSASLITTAAPAYKQNLEQIHTDKNIQVVLNGSDISDSQSLEKISTNQECFEITYAGRFYGHQRLETFLKGYKKFLEIDEQHKNSRVVFYGLNFYHGDVVRLRSFNGLLNDHFITTDRIPYQELLKKLRGTHVLLLLSSKGANWLNAKIFDYLAVKRPILLVDKDYGVLEDIINNTNSGDSFENEDDVADYLSSMYEKFASNWDFEVKSTRTEEYTREFQGQKMLKLLKSL